MARFVAQVAEHRAVGLTQLRAPLFAHGVVGFGQIDSDDAVVMPRDHARPAGQRGQHVEGHAEGRLGGQPRRHRQGEADQRRHQPPPRALDAAEGVGIGGAAEYRAGAQQLTADAPRRLGRGGLGVCRQQPVAGRRAVQLGTAQPGTGDAG